MRQLKQRTAETRAVVATLKRAFPQAKVDAYRYSIGSIRVRVIDAQFSGKSGFKRVDMVSDALETLPEATKSDIIVVVPVTPAEHRTKYWSHDYDFDHPLPPGL
jgi:stress-induced morphogen